MEKLTKSTVINYVLWGAFILAMVSSIQHLASTFGTAEQAGREWLGWIPAVAVDAGLAALAYTIQQRKKAKRPTAILWGGVAGFAVVSALANLYHALAVEAVANSAIAEFLRTWGVLIAKAVLLSATLPVMYIFLGEIVSGDDAAEAKALETAAERERLREERQQKRLDQQAEAERLKAEAELLKAKQAAAEAEAAALRAKVEAEQPAPTPAQSEPIAVVCTDCGRSFRSVNARNAHRCEGKRESSEIITAVSEALNNNGRAHDPS